MPNSQHPTEQSLTVITGNIPQIKSPSRCPKGKRKATSLETPPRVERDGSRLKPLAKRPKPDMQQPNHIRQPSSSSLNAANLFEFSADAQASLFQPTPLARTEPTTGVISKSSGQLLTGDAPSGSILVYGDTATSSHWLSVGGEDNLIGLNNSAETAWGVTPSAKYPHQSYGLQYAGVQADTPSEQGKPLGQEWTGSTKSSSATRALHSHLEMISSLSVAISQISRKVRSTTFQPLCEADVETLLQQSENLQQSYFELKKCM